MNIDTALDKLNSLLPLVKRQKNLKPEYRILHREILDSFSCHGKAPDNIEQSALKILEDNDLIVLDDEEQQIVGAYPFSLKKTAHHIFNDNIDIYAMCAFDAVAIAPVFNIKLNTISHCHVTNERIEISQDSTELLTAKPSTGIFIGIRWQFPGICAADILCMEMVFLKDKNIALQWQGRNKSHSVFPLHDAIVFSINYFKPLLND